MDRYCLWFVCKVGIINKQEIEISYSSTLFGSSVQYYSPTFTGKKRDQQQWDVKVAKAVFQCDKDAYTQEPCGHIQGHTFTECVFGLAR